MKFSNLLTLLAALMLITYGSSCTFGSDEKNPAVIKLKDGKIINADDVFYHNSDKKYVVSEMNFDSTYSIIGRYESNDILEIKYLNTETKTGGKVKENSNKSNYDESDMEVSDDDKW